MACWICLSLFKFFSFFDESPFVYFFLMLFISTLKPEILHSFWFCELMGELANKSRELNTNNWVSPCNTSKPHAERAFNEDTTNITNDPEFIFSAYSFLDLFYEALNIKGNCNEVSPHCTVQAVQTKYSTHSFSSRPSHSSLPSSGHAPIV